MVWLQNYLAFEQGRTGTNRLILNFYNLAQPESVKVYLKQNLKIATSPIFYWDDKEFLDDVKNLTGFAKKVTIYLGKDLDYYTDYLKEKGITVEPSALNNTVFSFEIENNPETLKKIPITKAQTKNRERCYKFEHFPERKVTLDIHLEEAFRKITSFSQTHDENLLQEISTAVTSINPRNRFFYNEKKKHYELELDTLDGITFNNEFLTEQEIEHARWWFGDIEKPLFKTDEEKNWMRRRLKLIKQKKKEKDQERMARIDACMQKLEDRLTIEIPEVGQIKLYEEAFDAKISWFTSLFQYPDGTTRKELHTLHDTGKDEANGYKIYKHDSEKQLLEAVVHHAKQEKPLFFVGHVLTYDVIQSRLAAKKLKTSFDIAVDEVQPRRDYVRKSEQRMKEDLIYLDTKDLTKIFFPYIKGKTVGGSFKLEYVANFTGYDFKKTISYAEMRVLEIQAIAAPDPEVRKKAALKIAEYASADVDPLVHIVHSQPIIPFLVELKKLLPFCTYTELLFSPRAIKRLPEKKFFEKLHYQKEYGYKQKKLNDRRQIFKKRFPQLKRDRLESVNIHPPIVLKKDHANVLQCYFPLEDWLKDLIFIKYPEVQDFYNRTKDNPKMHFAALQYLKVLFGDMFMDYYFCRRERLLFEAPLKKRGIPEEKIVEQFSELEKKARKEVNSYHATFDHAKNLYRSIYVALDERSKSLIREKTKIDRHQLVLPFVEEEKENNADLYALLRQSDMLKAKLSEKDQKNLKRYKKLFAKKEEIAAELKEVLKGINGSALADRDFLDLHNQYKRARRSENEFFRTHGISPYPKEKKETMTLKTKIDEYYYQLSKELREKKPAIVLLKGDYLFLTDELPSPNGTILPIRKLNIFAPSPKDVEDLLFQETAMLEEV